MTNGYFHASKILSYNALFSFIISNRNYGKTWGFKKRAWVRAMKRHKKTIWVRRFKKEVKECSATFYASKDLITFIGTLEPYNAETKKGNCKQIGNTFYIRHGRRWEWFLKIVALSDANAMRSADDVAVDTIIFDEFTTTPERYRKYRGNEVGDFCDMFFSAKRTHEIRCFFLGNNESVSSPYMTYFGIKPLPMTWQGLRTYRKGSIVLQKINNKPKAKTEYDDKVKNAFMGTAYGDYIYKDTYRTGGKFNGRKPPKGAITFVQLNWQGVEISIKVDGTNYYCTGTVDKTQPVWCSQNLHKYSNEKLLVKSQKRLFTSFINALSDNRVYYDNAATFEAVLPFRQWLGC